MSATVFAMLLLLDCGNGDIQWNGISHVAHQDRRPLCPVNREPFSVYLHAYRLDLCSVRVIVTEGANTSAVDAWYSHDRGPYAVWRADLPGATGDQISYHFELIDRDDVDYYSAAGMSDGPPSGSDFTLHFATLAHAPLGATPVSNGVVFRVWAPSPTHAWVRGEFNGYGFNNLMTRLGDDFVAHVPAAQVGQRFKYFFQPGSIWKPDPRARRFDGASNPDSYILDPHTYAWSTPHFQTPPWEDLILYQLHVGTFSGRNDPVGSGAIPGTFLDVAAHVDHLVDLGINAVQLMPVTEHPWDFSAGYNPNTMFAPEQKLGTPDDFRTMVDTLHAHGIAVLLDIVWNHVEANDNHLWFYDGTQIYFRTPDAQTPWGSQADFGRPEVRQYYIDSAIRWFDEYRVDGFRADGTAYMNIFPQEAEGWSLMQWLNDVVDNRYADKIAIAEQLPNNPWVTRPTSLGGAGFDAQWWDAFTDNVRQAIFDAAFGDPSMWAVADALDGGGEYLTGRNLVNYVESHDEIWPSTGGQRLIKTIDPTFPHDDVWARGRHKLAYGLTMFAPGIPMIHQGSEWLEDTDFTGGDPSGGGRIDWSKRATYANIFRYFKDIITARKNNGGLRATAPYNVYHVNDVGNVIAFHRYDMAGNDLIVIANFSNTNYGSYWLGLPQPGAWYELINSQSAAYDGNDFGNGGVVQTSGGPMHGFAYSADLKIPQMGLLLLRYNDPPDLPCPEDCTGDGQRNQADLALLLSCYNGGPCCDIDGDGATSQSDLAALLAVYGAACP